eukprot:3921000-Rhodomonas_salina.3
MHFARSSKAVTVDSYAQHHHDPHAQYLTSHSPCTGHLDALQSRTSRSKRVARYARCSVMHNAWHDRGAGSW